MAKRVAVINRSAPLFNVVFNPVRGNQTHTKPQIIVLQNRIGTDRRMAPAAQSGQGRTLALDLEKRLLALYLAKYGYNIRGLLFNFNTYSPLPGGR